ncbi:hypothetical protein Aph01nite_42580 [Acrocarpospora phusangensis]|uniref:Uncharacterized protein n=1 Tax=Acrocarpospora phusangensis TaxID=1070424 RepID=A0A919QEE4_9ACTN|nr:hypothetical protein [Acrocarpospora phusangensis]GIH25948.1 hypothetical protein Aph01nite_42580 [Acrocarpospora phusangensis]
MPIQESSEDTVALDYGQFYLLDVDATFDIGDFSGETWFESVGSCAIVLGMTSGMYATVRLELWTETPDPVDPEDWNDDPIEAQLFSEFGEVCVSDLMNGDRTAYLLLGEEDAFWHVVGYRRPTSDPNYPEEYLFQFWKKL